MKKSYLAIFFVPFSMLTASAQDKPGTKIPQAEVEAREHLVTITSQKTGNTRAFLDVTEDKKIIKVLYTSLQKSEQSSEEIQYNQLSFTLAELQYNRQLVKFLGKEIVQLKEFKNKICTNGTDFCIKLTFLKNYLADTHGESEFLIEKNSDSENQDANFKIFSLPCEKTVNEDTKETIYTCSKGDPVRTIHARTNKYGGIQCGIRELQMN